MDGFNQDDRRDASEAYNRIEAMSEQIARLERGQRVSLRRLRRLPDLTAAAIVAAVSKRALLLIGLGIALGSLLGGAGIEVARRLAAVALGAR